ncbi:E3 ubiquitin-protein ligase TRIM39-like [Ambystoma mexicanum]|uniref:E3 ubiquitin-protein ligase TRIM39-like n=1 Tax=Ambystoma mexicanum TaxID=8296 RepID=UPI0037E72580
MAAAAPLQSLKEEATCSICLEYFTEPVSVECGHAFCLSCITQCWEALGANFPCPQCRETSQNKTLRPYRQLGTMVEIAKQLHAPSNTPQEENLCREHEETLLPPHGKLSADGQWLDPALGHSPITSKDKLYSHMEHLKKELKEMQEWGEEESRKASELEDVKSVLSRCSEVKALKPQEDDSGMETPLLSIRRHAQLLAELKETFPAEMDWRYVKSCEPLAVGVIDRLSERCDWLVSEPGFSLAGVVTLDSGTAHPRLIVSADGRSVRRGPRAQNLPDTPQRFTIYPCVLGRERLSSGRHYWEVEVGCCTRWTLGVCDESVPRKEKIPASPARGFWTVRLRGGQYKALTSPRTPLTPHAPPGVLGFFLDYEAGRLSVYDAQDRALLFTFPGAPFPRTLRPYFRTRSPEGGCGSSRGQEGTESSGARQQQRTRPPG